MMDNDFPPLPRSLDRDMKGVGNNQAPSSQELAPAADAQVLTIDQAGDIVLNCLFPVVYSKSLKSSSCPVRVSSSALKRSSHYFRTLLDSEKFQEGRAVLNAHSVLEAEFGSTEVMLKNANVHQLPWIDIEIPPFSAKGERMETMKIYFQILHSFGKSKPSGADATIQRLSDATISLLASLIVISDRFSSHEALNHAFSRAHRLADKNKIGRSKIVHRLATFQSNDEARIREAIYLALFLRDSASLRRHTHSLIIRGSINWLPNTMDGYAGIDKPIWWRIPSGMEDEMQFRHQCILDTISDVQNHFLRGYGAIDIFRSSPRELQCRRAYSNSRACDSFQLGEMIQFFTTRSKTISLESTISNHESDTEDGVEDRTHNYDELNGCKDTHGSRYPLQKDVSNHPTANPTKDLDCVKGIIASLRQCPEYQVDSNHLGCGIRRRLIPILDCIESFTGSQSLLGICLQHSNIVANGPDSWRNTTFRDQICVSLSGSVAIPNTYQNKGVEKLLNTVKNGAGANGARDFCDCGNKGQLGRAVFTVKRRQWEK